jgi:hypothetical protein
MTKKTYANAPTSCVYNIHFCNLLLSPIDIPIITYITLPGTKMLFKLNHIQGFVQSGNLLHTRDYAK